MKPACKDCTKEHENAEHAGSIGIIDPRLGPDEQKAAQRISKGSDYRDPWAFSESSFMAAKGSQIILMDGDGNEQTIRPKGNYPPRALGSGASRLIRLCDGFCHGATLTDKEKTIIRLWCETGATYPGTYSGLGSGMVGGYAEL